MIGCLNLSIKISQIVIHLNIIENNHPKLFFGDVFNQKTKSLFKLNFYLSLIKIFNFN